jgi:hypothetical protein
MTAPPLLAGLIGQDVFRRWYFVPILYALYGVAAILALYHMRETHDPNLHDLDLAEPDLTLASRMPKESVL